MDGAFEAPPPGGESDANVAAYLADVDVDPETGEVDVRNVVLAIDVGTIINPTAHQGQLVTTFQSQHATDIARVEKFIDRLGERLERRVQTTSLPAIDSTVMRVGGDTLVGG